ncbi:MAG: hypothetical protein RL033_1773 [Pseudomonadota bacterium]|jgi:2C-methyl-D-erythritol 2,4-cyclodiphosphate synthase
MPQSESPNLGVTASEAILSAAQLSEYGSSGPSSGPSSEAPPSQQRQVRSYVRSFAATNYLLGKRGSALGEGLCLEEPQVRELLQEVTEQLSNGVQANRARVLAAEVGRVMRSLSTQRLK